MDGDMTSSLGVTRFDTLTVFQASPLVWRDANNESHPFGGDVVYFDCDGSQSHEREVITKSLGQAKEVGAEVYPIFETGTTKLLSELFASGSRGGACRALHFSCHGGRDCLYLEDGQLGLVCPVAVNHLPDFVSAGGGSIKFVFIFACHSFAAGTAFLKAGVRHVVCCRENEELADEAAIVFCRAFYSALAHAKTLRVAFEIGRQAVKMSSDVVDAENEMKKLLLLPERKFYNHDVPVFYREGDPKLSRSSLSQQEQKPAWVLAKPPCKFVGRGKEIHEVLCQLKRGVRLVRLVGAAGMGKISLAAAVCHFIKDRSKSLDVQQVIWLPDRLSTGNDELSSSMRFLSGQLQAASAFDHSSDGKYRKAVDVIMTALEQKKVVIAIDAKDLKGQELSKFLSELFGWAGKVMIILVCRGRVASESVPRTGFVESTIRVSPLPFRHSALLFGTSCPLLSKHTDNLTPAKFSEVIVPKHEEDITASSCLSERSALVFRIIGEGIPAKTIDAAGLIKKEQFDELLKICKICNLDFLNFTTGREKKLKKLADDLELNVNDHHQKAVETVPPLQVTSDKGSSSEEVCEVVGIDFNVALTDMDEEWAKKIAKSRAVIDGQIETLLELTQKFMGGGEVLWKRREIEYMERDQRELAVVTMLVDIEMEGELRGRDRRKIQRCCESIAKVLRRSGVPDNILQDMMLGQIWKGSLHLLLDAPAGIFEKLLSLLLDANMRLPLGDDTFMISVVPAFLFKASSHAWVRFRRFFRIEHSEGEKDVLHFKQNNFTFLVGASPAASGIVSSDIAMLKGKSEEEWLRLSSVGAFVDLDNTARAINAKGNFVSSPDVVNEQEEVEMSNEETDISGLIGPMAKRKPMTHSPEERDMNAAARCLQRYWKRYASNVLSQSSVRSGNVDSTTHVGDNGPGSSSGDEREALDEAGAHGEAFAGAGDQSKERSPGKDVGSALAKDTEQSSTEAFPAYSRLAQQENQAVLQHQLKPTSYGVHHHGSAPSPSPVVASTGGYDVHSNAGMERLGVDLNATGSVMTRAELEEQRRKRGECLTCGRKCFQKKIFKMVPITDHGRVLEGRCLNCKPLEVAWGSGGSGGSGGMATQAVAAMAAHQLASKYRRRKEEQEAGGGGNGGGAAPMPASRGSSSSESNLYAPVEQSSRSVMSESTIHSSRHRSGSGGHPQTIQEGQPNILNRGGAVDFRDGRPAPSSRSMNSSASGRSQSSRGSTPRGSPHEQEEDFFAQRAAAAAGGQHRADHETTYYSTRSGRDVNSQSSVPNDAEVQIIAQIQDPKSSFRTIVDLMKANQVSAIVQEEAFKTLSELQMTAEELDDLSAAGGLDAVVRGMTMHASSSAVQSAACRALWNLSATPENQVAIGDSGGVDAILKAMSDFDADAEVLETALAALSNLGASDQNQAVIQDGGGIQEIVLAMNRFSENTNVQETGCAALTNLASRDSSVKVAIAKAGGADAVVISMVMHPGDVELQQKALRALRNLCANNDENKRLVANVGGIDAVISAMQVHRDDAGVQEAGAWTLSNLAVNAENKAIIGESGGIDVIVRAMWVHSDHAGVQEWTCRALWTLSVDPNNKEIITEVGGISAVVNAMQAHVDTAPVQEKGCGVLSNLAANDDNNKIRIVEEEALDAVVMAMVIHPDNRVVQERACTVLRKLAFGPNVKPMQAANVAPLMQQAADKFPEQCKEKADYVLAML